MYRRRRVREYPFRMAVPAQVERRSTLTLVAEPAAAKEARTWIAELAGSLLSPDRRNDLRLVVTEVVTNAIRHGDPGGSLLLAATPKDGYLCVQCTDDGPGLAPRPRAMVPDEDGGFGLFLVERLTRRWGVTRERGRTRVWFELDYLAP
jgi:anti-sigma regulatory factor (Ser/Thr protein kinase)